MGERVPWLREAMAGTWAALGGDYVAYRDGVVAFVARSRVDTVVVSHFVAINAVIGACLGDDRLVIRSLDNASVTIVDTAGGRLVLVERRPRGRHPHSMTACRPPPRHEASPGC